MSCINKSDRGYKVLANIYGDNLAEAFVRAYPINKKSNEDNYYIPTATEVKDWLTEQKNDIFKKVRRGLEINPYLSEDGLKSMLKGVISKHNGTYFVTTGWLYGGSSALTAETFNTVFKPNLAIMEKLESTFPDIFSLRRTKNPNTVIVNINPIVNIQEELEEEDDTRPPLAQSMDVYKNLVEKNKGLKPSVFMAGNFKWALNKNNLYNLIDADTNLTFMRNVDLESGTIVPEIEMPGEPLDEAKRDRLFRYIMKMIKEQGIDNYLAEKGIDTADIYEDLLYAETQEDLNKITETLLNTLC
jgi:hypothetical protein